MTKQISQSLELVDNKRGTSFSEVLRNLMHRKNMTQMELAYAADISQSYISRIVKGKRELTENLAVRISEPLGVNANAFLRAYQETVDGSSNSLDHYLDALLERRGEFDLLGKPIRQLRDEDILEVFSEKNEGLYEFRGAIENVEIDPFDLERVRVSSYDTVAHCLLGNLTSGRRKMLSDENESIPIPNNSVVRVKVLEFIALPSWLEASIAPASNIAKKGLFVSHGPIIDPGWNGHLEVSVLNPTDEEILLSKFEPFLTLRFILTEV